jgi:adenylate cyclase
MATLIFTIWADHLQFETDATIVLKNPNFVFIFVLISLRALRFDPLLVVTSGITAALGWSMVIWHSLQMQGADYITWDYLTYVYTDRVFPIGELSKIFAILVLTGIMAYVVNRARRHLRDAVGNALAASDLSLFFDASVADKIRSLEEIPGAGRGELRDAAIMFIDLRGFTRASQKLSADALIQMLGDYQQRMVTIISAHGGSIDKFMGDGILVSFGATRTQPDYAARALACMESILADTHVWRASSAVAAEYALDIGLGIASGSVVFGMIGHATRLEFTVLGEPVNLAAKLEKHNKTLGVHAVVLLETYLLARAQGYVPQSEITTHTASAVAGSATPIDVVSVR